MILGQFLCGDSRKNGGRKAGFADPVVAPFFGTSRSAAMDSSVPGAWE